MPHSETYVDGVWYPSVTTILSNNPKPWLTRWRERWGSRAEWKTRAANVIGTAFHHAAERLVRGEDVVVNHRRLYPMLEQLERWRTVVDFQPLDTELKVISHTHKYAGTLDATGTTKSDRHIAVFDWKTSSGIYPDMALQLAAYAMAYEEQTGHTVKYGWIICVSKDKPHHKLTVKRFTLGKRVRKEFLKRLYEFNKAMGTQIRGNGVLGDASTPAS